MDIADRQLYTENMRKSLMDKAFFIDKIDAKHFVDFGCADGSLLKFLKTIFPNSANYVGYDTLLHNEISNTNSLRNIITTLRKKCPDLVIKNIKDIGYIMHKSDSQLL